MKVAPGQLPTGLCGGSRTSSEWRPQLDRPRPHNPRGGLSFIRSSEGFVVGLIPTEVWGAGTGLKVACGGLWAGETSRGCGY